MRHGPLLLTACLVMAGCGGGPAAPSSFAQIAGNWTGTLQSANWTAAPVIVTLSQTDSTVTGTWASTDFDWNGTITGVVTSTAFSGTFTISAPTESGTGPRCTGNATVTGPASTGGTTLAWTSAGFTSACTNAPSGITWNLRR